MTMKGVLADGQKSTDNGDESSGSVSSGGGGGGAEYDGGHCSYGGGRAC